MLSVVPIQPVIPQAGDILIVHGTSIPDWFIRFATSSRDTHSVLVVDQSTGIEAQAGRNVGYVDLRNYKGRSTLYRLRGVTPEECEKAIDAAHQWFGQPYGWEAIGFDAMRFVFHLPVIRHIAYYRDCSMLDNDAWAKAGHPISYAPYPAPSDLAWSGAMVRIGNY